MSIFKLKKNTASDKRKHLELVFDDHEKNALAFGLQWRSIVTSDARKAGIAMARAQGATHLLFRGQQVGYGVIDAKVNTRLSSGASVYPAAQVAARQYGGDALFVVNVGKGEYWIALIRNGSPTSSDTFLSDSNDSVAIAEAHTLLEAVSGESSRVSIYTNLGDHGFSGSIKPVSTEDMMLAATHDDDRLSVMPRPGMSIPRPILIVVGLGALALMGQEGFKWWEAKKRAALLAQNRVAGEDPAVVWARVIADWESSKVSPNAVGLLAARESMGRLPVLWDGWTLSNAKCNAIPLTTSAKVRAWGCTAVYERAGAGGKLNRDMLPAIPKDWGVTFTPLKTMQVTWSLQQPIVPLRIAELKPTSFHSIETTSRFQALAPAFSQDVKFDFAPVNIPAPKAPDGSALPADPVVAALRVAGLNLRGPLRTVDALIERDIPADWDSIGITFSVSNSTISINSSAVSAEVTGAIYAKN